MAESSIGITEGSGVNLHTWSRTIASTTRQDQFVLPGEQGIATYVAAATVRTNTANSHLMFLQGDGTSYLRVRRVTIRQANIASAASTMDIRVYRTSTAGSGGSSVSARSLDESDSAWSGTIQTLPTSKGTEGNQLLSFRLPAAAANPLGDVVEWRQAPQGKPIICGNGTANGIAIKNISSIAMEVDVEVEFSLTAYL